MSNTEMDQWLDKKFDLGLELAAAETFYTAYALTSRGREEIERYPTIKEAFEDMLNMWPEDDDGDAVIEDKDGVVLIYFSRSLANPAIVHCYHKSVDGSGPNHVESYKCVYEPALGGSVRTNIKRLG